LLQKQGHEAQLLNALKDDFGQDLGMIFANAVLLHFNPSQFAEVLNKAYHSLKPGGIIAFTVKKGEGEEWTEQKLNAPRYFCYWQAALLKKVVKQIGFKQIDVSESTGKEFTWLQVIAIK
jgi:SAM-dependent methyltransferase